MLKNTNTCRKHSRLKEALSTLTRKGLFFDLVMQRFYNLLAVMAFAMAGTLTVGGVLFYTRIPSLTKRYVSELKLELTQLVLDSMPAPEMPSIPTETGPAIPGIQ